MIDARGKSTIEQSICDEGSIHPSAYLIRLQGPGCKAQNLQADAFTNLIIVRRKPTLIQPDPYTQTPLLDNHQQALSSHQYF